MCPDEFIELSRNDSRPLERDRQGQRFEQLAIKKYGRPAADVDVNVPSLLRPPIVLYVTMKYMRDCLAD